MARSAGIELVVQTGPETDIGLVNRRAYELLSEDRLARPLQIHAADSSEPSNEEPSPWLSLAVSRPVQEHIPLVYETLRVVDRDEGHPAFEAGRKMARYTVVGIWFESCSDDPYLGAEITEDRSQCDALLI